MKPEPKGPKGRTQVRRAVRGTLSDVKIPKRRPGQSRIGAAGTRNRNRNSRRK